MWFDNIPSFFYLKLPPELWLIVKKYYLKNYLSDNLTFPVILPRRLDHEFFADYWQAYMRKHRWDIETGNAMSSTLISQSFNDKRVAIDWSGLLMVDGERIFGIGFNVSQNFLDAVWFDTDFMDVDLLPSISSEDELEWERNFY